MLFLAEIIPKQRNLPFVRGKDHGLPFIAVALGIGGLPGTGQPHHQMQRGLVFLHIKSLPIRLLIKSPTPLGGAGEKTGRQAASVLAGVALGAGVALADAPSASGAALASGVALADGLGLAVFLTGASSANSSC